MKNHTLRGQYRATARSCKRLCALQSMPQAPASANAVAPMIARSIYQIVSPVQSFIVRVLARSVCSVSHLSLHRQKFQRSYNHLGQKWLLRILSANIVDATDGRVLTISALLKPAPGVATVLVPSTMKPPLPELPESSVAIVACVVAMTSPLLDVVAASLL